MFNYELRDRVERLCQELSDPSQGEHEPMLSLFFRRACSFNKTIHYETNETHVRNETYGAHEGARAMVAGKTPASIPTQPAVRTKCVMHSSRITSGWLSIWAMAKSNCMTPAIIAFPACSNTRAGADGR
jgi:hypothetical protein